MAEVDHTVTTGMVDLHTMVQEARLIAALS